MLILGQVLLALNTAFFFLNGYLLVFVPGSDQMNLASMIMGVVGIMASFFILHNASMRQ